MFGEENKRRVLIRRKENGQRLMQNYDMVRVIKRMPLKVMVKMFYFNQTARIIQVMESPRMLCGNWSWNWGDGKDKERKN